MGDVVSKLEEQLRRTLLPGMYVPEPLVALFHWIEENNLYYDQPTGERVGFLYPLDQIEEGWTEEERHGGTIIHFFAAGNAHLKHWFGHDRAEVLDRLCVFAKTGADGSKAALWLAPNGEQKIVHLGSGSGSQLVCVLAEDPVDFIRLLAIGYDEIAWGELFALPPHLNDSFLVYPNKKYQQWVQSAFPGDIPQTALEIVKHPEYMDDEQSEDEFHQWVRGTSPD